MYFGYNEYVKIKIKFKGYIMGRRCPNCNTKMNLQIIFEKRRKKSNPYYICDKCNNKIKYQPKESKTQDLLLTDMKAQAYSNSYQNTFFQSFAIPKKLLDNIYKEDFIYDKFVDSSKWRLDHTLKDEKFRIDRELKNILLIIKKILLRGKLTLISPFLEKKIKKLLNLKNKTFTINNLQNLEVKINKDFDNEETIIDFQSPYEKLFYEKILPNLFGKEILKYTTPQVYLS